MKTTIKAALGVLAAGILWTSAAGAAEIVGPAALQSLLTSRTLYTEGFKHDANRYDHVQLSKNGSAQTNYVVYKTVHGFHTVPLSGRTYGTWQIQGSNVCITWNAARNQYDGSAKSGCFRIERVPGSEFSQPNYRATNVANGQSWDFRVIN